MPNWTRWEKWDPGKATFVELAIEGSTLFVRSGRCRVGPAVKVETRAMASMEEARAALDAEQSALLKKKFVREKTFDAPLPKAPLALKKTRAKGRWPAGERARLRRAFFDRLRAVGIDPDRRFDEQTGSPTADVSGPGARDANARASTCLEIAEAVLRVEFRRTYFGRDLTGEHEPFAAENARPVPFEHYARFDRSPAHVFSIAARASADASTGASDGRS